MLVRQSSAASGRMLGPTRPTAKRPPEEDEEFVWFQTASEDFFFCFFSPQIKMTHRRLDVFTTAPQINYFTSEHILNSYSPDLNVKPVEHIQHIEGEKGILPRRHKVQLLISFSFSYK